MPARLRAPSRAAWYSRLAADPPSCAGVNCVAHEAMVDASVSAAYGGSSSGSARPLASPATSAAVTISDWSTSRTRRLLGSR